MQIRIRVPIMRIPADPELKHWMCPDTVCFLLTHGEVVQVDDVQLLGLVVCDPENNHTGGHQNHILDRT